MTAADREQALGVSVFFRWYDLWVGVYIDRANRTVYICPVPMFGIKIALRALGEEGS